MKNSEIPGGHYPAVLARYKILSNLNIAERRIPQDGKISLEGSIKLIMISVFQRYQLSTVKNSYSYL